MRFNLIGFVMFLVSIAVSTAITRALGTSSSGWAMLLGGPLLSLLDLGYRAARGSRKFGSGGGTIFFLPMWLWGMVFTAAAVVNLARGH